MTQADLNLEVGLKLEVSVNHCWQHCCHCGHCSFAIAIAIAIAVPLQFSFGYRPSLAAVISDKRPGRKPRKRTGEIKQHERNLHI